MADYSVEYDEGCKLWSAKRDGATRAAGTYSTQAAAHEAAEGFVERSGGGVVRDYGKDSRLKG